MKSVFTYGVIAAYMIVCGHLFAANPPDDPEQDAFSRAYAKSVSSLTGRIEEYIRRDLVGDLGYSEFPPARQYLMRDLDGDRKDDLLLITRFGLPSGGNYEQSELLVVLSSDPANVQRITLGGRGSRVAQRIFEDNGAMHVYITYSVWARVDAQCCPSLSSTDEVFVEDHKVKLRHFNEIKRKDG